MSAMLLPRPLSVLLLLCAHRVVLSLQIPPARREFVAGVTGLVGGLASGSVLSSPALAAVAADPTGPLGIANGRISLPPMVHFHF